MAKNKGATFEKLALRPVPAGERQHWISVTLIQAGFMISATSLWTGSLMVAGMSSDTDGDRGHYRVCDRCGDLLCAGDHGFGYRCSVDCCGDTVLRRPGQSVSDLDGKRAVLHRLVWHQREHLRRGVFGPAIVFFRNRHPSQSVNHPLGNHYVFHGGDRFQWS